MRPLLAIACMALLTATLAGCAEDPERYPDGVVKPSTSRSASATASPTRTATSTGSATATSTGPGGNGTGDGVTASISVAVNGTRARFSLDGSGPDGATLTWALDFGDGNSTNGTALPASVDHTFAPGNYTADLTVSDGSANATDSVRVAVGNATGATFPVTFSEGVAASCPHCTFAPTNPCASWRAAMSGGDCAIFAMLPDYAGHPFLADSESTGAGADVGIEFFDSCDAAAANSLLRSDSSTSETGEVPAGSACAVLWSFTDPQATVTLTIS